MPKIATSEREPACIRELQTTIQQELLTATAAECRKAIGQFFTPWPVARFMARLLPLPTKSFRLLDPGAGAGVLSSAVCERLLAEGKPVSLHIDAVENDDAVLPYLEKVLAACQKMMRQAGFRMTFAVAREDFVLADWQRATDRERYDAAILNPPYFKINKASTYAAAMPHIIHGQPNIYPLFMAATAERLKPQGTMVAITPRSFCNGLYFRAFRHWFFDRMALDHVHLFRSRTDTFREASVLQESIITVASRRQHDASDRTVVSRSEDRELRSLHQQVLPTHRVLSRDDPDQVVFLPETDEDAEIVRYAQQWKTPFEEHGLRISTGPVVMFRVTEFLREAEKGGVPLLSAHNVRNGAITWPVSKKKWPLAITDVEASRRHLLQVRNYVLLKRFSAKEERRRLTAGCLFAEDFSHPRIGIENHLNYIYHADRELTAAETRGIAAVFNSVFFDRYFRTLSGNTQVNATEVRTLHFPDLSVIAAIGRRVAKLRGGDPQAAEHVVLDELGVDGDLRRYLEGVAA